MKITINYFFFILILVFGERNSLFSQAQTGQITYRHILNLNPKSTFRDTIGVEGHLIFMNEQSIYQWGINKGNKYVATDGRVFKSLSELRANGGRLNEIRGNRGDSIGEIFYKNSRTKQLIFRELVFKNYFIIEEPRLPHFEWKLTNETKQIGRFKSFKATSVFRGRSYSAWYTTEIALYLGPWKFSGLPGLILEVYDEAKEFWIKFESVQIPSTTNNLIVPPINGEKITFDAYKTIGKDEAERMSRTVSSNSNRGSNTNVSISRIPIEKVYED
jgi:GLPGLI family protein